MHICMYVYICPWSGPPGARGGWTRLSDPSWSPNKCVCLWMRVLACYVLGESPQLGALHFAPNHLHLALPEPLILAAQSAPGCRRLGWGSPALPLLARRTADLGGQGAPAATPTLAPKRPTSTPARGAPTGPPWPRSAGCPSLGSAGHGRSRAGATASTATDPYPTLGSADAVLQSMSRHRPRPGLRLGTARAGAAVQAWLHSFARSSPGGFASAPRSAPECVRRRRRRWRRRSQRRSARPGPPPPSPPSCSRPPASPPPPCPLPQLRGREVGSGPLWFGWEGTPAPLRKAGTPFAISSLPESRISRLSPSQAL